MKLRCSNCRKCWIDTALGQCDVCGLVLGQDANVVSVPMLGTEDDSAGEDVELDAEMAGSEDLPTTPSITGVTGASSLRHHGIPEKIPQAQMGGLSLTPFEGYLLSLVDGATFVDDVIAASGLALHEAAIALQNLKEKGLIRFRESVDHDAARRTATGELRPVEAVSTPPPVASVGRMELKRIAAGTAVPLEDPSEQIKLARDEATAGNFVRAREHARLAVMIEPENVEASTLLEQLESPAHAKTRAKHLHHLGSACQKAGDCVQAVEFYRAALQEWEPSAVIHHKLAVALALAGFPMQDAEQHLVRAVALAPTNAVYAQHLSQLRAQLYGAGAAPRV